MQTVLFFCGERDLFLVGMLVKLWSISDVDIDLSRRDRLSAVGFLVAFIKSISEKKSVTMVFEVRGRMLLFLLSRAAILMLCLWSRMKRSGHIGHEGRMQVNMPEMSALDRGAWQFGPFVCFIQWVLSFLVLVGLLLQTDC